MTQSSANMRILEDTCVGRSLIYIKNRRGPGTEPWETPDVTGRELEVIFNSDESGAVSKKF